MLDDKTSQRAYLAWRSFYFEPDRDITQRPQDGTKSVREALPFSQNSAPPKTGADKNTPSRLKRRARTGDLTACRDILAVMGLGGRTSTDQNI